MSGCAQIPTSTIFSTPVVTSISSANITEVRTVPGYTQTYLSYTTSCDPIIIFRRDQHDNRHHNDHRHHRRQSSDCFGDWVTYTVTSVTTVPPVTTTQVDFSVFNVTVTLPPVPIQTLFSSSCPPSTSSTSTTSSTSSTITSSSIITSTSSSTITSTSSSTIPSTSSSTSSSTTSSTVSSTTTSSITSSSTSSISSSSSSSPTSTSESTTSSVPSSTVPSTTESSTSVVTSPTSTSTSSIPSSSTTVVSSTSQISSETSPSPVIRSTASSVSSSHSVAPFIISPSNTETPATSRSAHINNLLGQQFTISSDSASPAATSSQFVLPPPALSSSASLSHVVFPVSPTTTTDIAPESTSTGLGINDHPGDKSSHKPSPGGIVGGTLGGLAFLAFLGVFVYKYVKEWSHKDGPKDKAKGPSHHGGGNGEDGQSLVDNLYHPGMFSPAAGYGATSSGGSGGKGGAKGPGNVAPPNGSGPEMTQVHHNAQPAAHGHHGAHGNPHGHSSTPGGHGAGGHGAGGHGAGGHGGAGGPSHAPPGNGYGGANGTFGNPAGGAGGAGTGGANPGGGFGGSTGLEGGHGGGGGGAGGHGATTTTAPGTGGELGGSSGGGGGATGTGAETTNPFTQNPGTNLPTPGNTATPNVTDVGGPYGGTGHESRVGDIIPVIVPIGARRRQADNDAKAKAAMMNTLPTPYYLPPSNPTSPALTPTVTTRLLDDGRPSMDGSRSNYASSQDHLQLPASRAGNSSSYTLDGDPFAGEPGGPLPTYQAGPSTAAYYGRNEKRGR